jgi:hypothetical protein
MPRIVLFGARTLDLTVHGLFTMSTHFLKSATNHAAHDYSMISHQCLFGMIKKKFMGRILSGIVEDASLAPLHTWKNSAVTRRSSIKAKL